MKYISRKERFKHFHGPMGTVTNAINTHREIQQCRNKNTQTHTHRYKLAVGITHSLNGKLTLGQAEVKAILITRNCLAYHNYKVYNQY